MKIKIKVPYFDRCTSCELYQYRTQVVHGDGPTDSDLVIVGQNPGKNEDEEGIPFIGKAGKILDTCLKRAGLKRKNIRITNAVHCLTPFNRPPSPDEIMKCFRWLEEEMYEIKPSVILAAGRVAMYALGIHDSVMRVNGKRYEMDYKWGECVVIPMIHPAAVIYAGEVEGDGVKKKITKAIRIARKCLE
jgi:DNA polymerase